MVAAKIVEKIAARPMDAIARALPEELESSVDADGESLPVLVTESALVLAAPVAVVTGTASNGIVPESTEVCGGESESEPPPSITAVHDPTPCESYAHSTFAPKPVARDSTSEM